MKSVFFSLLFVVVLVVAVAAGYRTGRGGLALPAWVPQQVSAVLAGLGPAPGAPPSTADLTDYEFRLIDQKAKLGAAMVAVELVNKATGTPVSDAVIFASRLDMAPESMAMMTAPLDSVPAGTPGTYRFKTNLVMEGGWQLSLAAKVPGEAGTVQGKLVLKAVQ